MDIETAYRITPSLHVSQNTKLKLPLYCDFFFGESVLPQFVVTSLAKCQVVGQDILPIGTNEIEVQNSFDGELCEQTDRMIHCHVSNCEQYYSCGEVVVYS